MFIKLTLKQSLKNVLININNISAIIDCTTCCEIYFTEKNDFVTVAESFYTINSRLEKLGFFKKL